jgi:hypothetical protein
VSDVVLVGPFWTRAETADYLGTSTAEVRSRADILRIEGHWLEETYPALQFVDHEVRYEVALVVEVLGDQLPGHAIADWLTRPNSALGALTPLQWFDTGNDVNTALNVAQAGVETAAARVQRPQRVGVAAS